MSAKHVYECENCGNSVEISSEDAKVPECCNRPMKEVGDLDACQVSTTAEHSRLDDFDDACDDGRSGKV